MLKSQRDDATIVVVCWHVTKVVRDHNAHMTTDDVCAHVCGCLVSDSESIITIMVIAAARASDDALTVHIENYVRIRWSANCVHP